MKISYVTAKEIHSMLNYFPYKAKKYDGRYTNYIFVQGDRVCRTDGCRITIIELKNKLNEGNFEAIDFKDFQAFVQKKDKSGIYINTDLQRTQESESNNLFTVTDKATSGINSRIVFTINAKEFESTLTRLLTLRKNPIGQIELPGISMIIKPWAKGPTKQRQELTIYGKIEGQTDGTKNKHIDAGQEVIDINVKVNEISKTFVFYVNAEFLTGFLNKCLGRYCAVIIQDNKKGMIITDDVDDDITNEVVKGHYSIVMPMNFGSDRKK